MKKRRPGTPGPDGRHAVKSCLTWKKAGGLGVAVAIVVLIPAYYAHLSWVWVIPGLLVQMLIAGWPEPGPYSVINTLASLAELMVNLAFSVVVIYGARRLLRRA